MFCHKCGAQLVNGAEFCQKCGAKAIDSQLPAPELRVSVPKETVTSEPPADQTAQPPVQKWTTQPQPQYAVPSATAPVVKKKSKIPLIIGAVVLMIVAVLVVLNWEGKADYIGSVKAHKPFDKSQGLPYTYEEVLEKYLPDAEWISEKTDSGSNVIIIGKLAGTETSVIFTVEATHDPDDEGILWMRPQSVQVDSYQTSDQYRAVEFFLALFLAYDKGHETVPDFPELLLALGMPEEVKLTETYTNEDEGISFQYPGAWKQFSQQDMKELDMDYPSDTTLAVFLNMVDFFPELSSGIEILKFEDSQETLEVLYLDDEDFAKTWSSNITISETSIIEIDGVPVRKLIYTTEASDRYRSYLYGHGSTLYRINFMRSGVAEDDLADYFDAIIDTFSIDLPEDESTSTANTDEICFNGTPISSFINASTAEIKEATGIPANADRNDQVRLYIYSGNVTSIEITDADILTKNGESLKKNVAGLLELLGEPDSEDLTTGYSMGYNLPDCNLYIELGSPTSEAWRITISAPRPDVAYRGMPVADLMGLSQGSAFDILGYPDSGTVIDGTLYSGGKFFGYKDGGIFILDYTTGMVSTAFGKPTAFTVNGSDLNRSRDEIVALLGEPTEETDNYDEMQGTTWHYINYEMNGITIQIRMPSSEGNPDRITIVSQ